MLESNRLLIVHFGFLGKNNGFSIVCLSAAAAAIVADQIASMKKRKGGKHIYS